MMPKQPIYDLAGEPIDNPQSPDEGRETLRVNRTTTGAKSLAFRHVAKDMSKRSSLLLLMLAVLFTVGCGKKPSKDNLIRIGVLKHESSLSVYVAQDRGFFHQAGVEVALVELPPSDHLPALLSGRVDMISPTSFPTLFGAMSQAPDDLFAVMPGAEVSDGPVLYGLIVRPDASFTKVTDLAKKTVIAINPFTRVNLQMVFSAVKLPADQMPTIKVASREAALQAITDGTADAAIMDQPGLATAIASKNYKLIEGNLRARYVGSPYWSGAGAVRRIVWERRKEDLQKAMFALDNAIDFTRKDSVSAHRILAAKLGLGQDIADQLGGYYFPKTTEKVGIDGIQKTVEALKAAGLLEKPLSLDHFFPSGLHGQP